jgi:hypothetical protein
MFWIVLYVIAVVLLVWGFYKRGGAWGGATIGAILGIIVAAVFWFMDKGFSWILVLKIATVVTLVGEGIELLGLFTDRVQSKDDRGS